MTVENDTNLNFDIKLAKECAESFSVSSGLGCTVSDEKGNIVYTTGYACEKCNLCSKIGLDRVGCVQSQIYGMVAAQRYGGKYIYFCPVGLTCFVSPIIGEGGSSAKLTAGPFLMTDPEDFVEYDLKCLLELQDDKIDIIMDELKNIPQVSTQKVNALSNLLFMSVGFMNDVSASNRLLENKSSEEIQSQIYDYLSELKSGEKLPRYPIEAERKLISSISASNKEDAQRLLNEILGHILLCSGGNFETIKQRVTELIILISRAAINGGAELEISLKTTQKDIAKLKNILNIEQLCFWITDVMNKMIDSVFSFEDAKHFDVIHKSISFLREHYSEKVTLSQVSQQVYLSPTYFSKIFKEETGNTFNAYLNNLRIEKSKALLLSDEIPLADVATAVGFEDQSYFTKVFKRVTGFSPNKYKEKKNTAVPKTEKALPN